MALARLNDLFRDLDDSADMPYVAARILGETLGVSRAGYGLVDRVAETIAIDRDWNAPGVVSIAGTLSFRDYGSYIDDLKRGETATVNDTRLDPRTADASAVLETIDARAFINMPLTEQGDFVTLIFVNEAVPRQWSDDDLAFVREVAERTRDATERRQCADRRHGGAGPQDGGAVRAGPDVAGCRPQLDAGRSEPARKRAAEPLHQRARRDAGRRPHHDRDVRPDHGRARRA